MNFPGNILPNIMHSGSKLYGQIFHDNALNTSMTNVEHKLECELTRPSCGSSYPYHERNWLSIYLGKQVIPWIPVWVGIWKGANFPGIFFPDDGLIPAKFNHYLQRNNWNHWHDNSVLDIWPKVSISILNTSGTTEIEYWPKYGTH